MPLDSNSRFIAGLCGAALIVLVTWLHADGRGFDRGVARCESDAMRQQHAHDCATCHQDAPTSLAADDTPQEKATARIVTAAPRS